MGYTSPYIIIEEQTATELTVKRKDTVNQLWAYNTNCPITTQTTLDSVTGAGLLYYVMYRTQAVAGSHSGSPQILADSISLTYPDSYATHNSFGFDGTTNIFQLVKYAVDGEIIFTANFPTGIPFNTDLALKYYNGGGAAHTVTALAIYGDI